MSDNKTNPLAICPLMEGGDHAERLLDFANRKLSVEASLVIEQHAASCAACSAFVESQRAVWNALDEWDAAEISADFDRRLWARIEVEERAPWYVRLWNRATDFGEATWRPVVPVAAVLVLAIGLWVKPFTGSTAPADPALRVDAEQLESALEEIEMVHQLSPAEPPQVQQM